MVAAGCNAILLGKGTINTDDAGLNTEVTGSNATESEYKYKFYTVLGQFSIAGWSKHYIPPTIDKIVTPVVPPSRIVD